MSKISISQIINYSYVRYDKLTELINLEYNGSNASKINMYIDLYSILKPLYSTNIVIDDYTEITSCIINMCAHYKYFFKSRYNVDSRIYLIWSSNCPYKNKNIYPEYNKKFEYTMQTNKKITSIISNNLELLEILYPYIPDVMYVTDLYETGVIIQYISEMQDNIGIPGLVLSRDAYNFQLAKGMFDMKILVPYKHHTDKGTVDSSYIVNSQNSIIAYLNKLNVKTEGLVLFSSELLSLLMSISRVPTRNINSLYNIPKAYNLISEMIRYKAISNSHIYDIKSVAMYLNQNIKNIEARYYICDIKSQLIHYQIDPAINVKQSMINLYDPEQVKNINNQYFQKYPLDLNRL